MLTTCDTCDKNTPNFSTRESRPVQSNDPHKPSAKPTTPYMDLVVRKEMKTPLNLPYIRSTMLGRISPFLVKGLKEDHSAFGWARKGVWSTAETEDVTERRLGDWFRIGFEPLFADFTQAGAWFAVYALLEVPA